MKQHINNYMSKSDLAYAKMMGVLAEEGNKEAIKFVKEWDRQVEEIEAIEKENNMAECNIHWWLRNGSHIRTAC